tara:strand:- start:249 stop:1700 length:1452 start_codon:yes stop_codon:yes gene_type:complete
VLLLPTVTALQHGTDSVDNSWTTINFDETFTTRPIVFTQVNTENEADLTLTRLRGVQVDSFQVKLQEDPGTYDGTHASEDLAWLAVEPHELDESVSFRFRQNNPLIWRTFNFMASFSDTPYFLSQVQSTRNWQPVQTDIANLDSSGFEMRMEETYNFDSIHPKEIVGFLAFEEWTNAEYDTISVDTTWQTVTFSEEFLNTPQILASINSENENDMVIVKVNDVTTTGFEIKIEEDPNFDGVHSYENITYLALGEMAEVWNIAIVDTGSSGIDEIEDILTDAGHSYTLMDYSYVETTLDSSYDGIIYPGGVDGVNAVIYNSYPNMVSTIQDFVDDGGFYIGICGGAIVGSNGLIYDGWDVSSYTTQFDLLEVDSTWYNDWTYYVGNMENFGYEYVLEHEIFSDYTLGDVIGLDYAGGPTLATGTEEMLIEYNEDLDPSLDGYTVTGEGALAVGEYGSGKVVLSAIHPEYNNEELLVSYMEWAMN